MDDRVSAPAKAGAANAQLLRAFKTASQLRKMRDGGERNVPVPGTVGPRIARFFLPAMAPEAPEVGSTKPACVVPWQDPLGNPAVLH